MKSASSSSVRGFCVSDAKSQKIAKSSNPTLFREAMPVCKYSAATLAMMAKWKPSGSGWSALSQR